MALATAILRVNLGFNVNVYPSSNCDANANPNTNRDAIANATMGL